MKEETMLQLKITLTVIVCGLVMYYMGWKFKRCDTPEPEPKPEPQQEHSHAWLEMQIRNLWREMYRLHKDDVWTGESEK